MNFRTTYVLFGILACLFLVLGLALWLAPVPTSASNFVFPSLNVKEGETVWLVFDHLEIDRGEVAPKLVFDRDARTDLWTVSDGKATYPADSGKVNRLVQSICKAKKVPAEKPRALKDWGLDNPDAVITLKSGDGKREVKLSIGNSSPGDDRTAVTYVLSSEYGSEPLAVSREAVSLALGPLASFRDRDLLAATAPNIEAVEIQGKVDGKEKTVALKKVEERWQFTEPFVGEAQGEGPESTPEQPIKSAIDLTTALADLKVEYRESNDNDFVADDVKDWAKYFLDPAKFDVLRIKVRRVITPAKREDREKVEKTVTLLIALKEKVGEKKDRYYARIEGEDSVYRVSAKLVDRIREVLNDPSVLRDRHLVKLMSFAGPDVIEIARGGDKLDFRRAGPDKPWMLYRGGTGVVVDQLVVKGLIDLLVDTYPTMDFPPPSDDAALGLKDAKDAAAVVSIWVGGIEPEEKDKDKDKKDKDKDKKIEETPKKPGKPVLRKDVQDKPTYTLTFGKRVTGKHDEKLVAVKRVAAGEKTGTLMLVPVVVLERVEEGPLFYYSRTLPQYNPMLPAPLGVTRLLVERDGKKTEVAREKEGEPWKMVLPESVKGRPANRDAIEGDVLHALNHLRATRLIAEKATDKELADTYGLKSPYMRVTITRTRDNKPEQFVYEFGRDVPTNKAERYARQVFPKGAEAREMIFTVDWEKLRPELEKTFEDLTLFAFKPEDVRRLKLTGWEQLIALTTIELESEDGKTWKKTKGPDLQIDSAKVAGLIAYLSKLKAEKIVAPGAADKAEYGINVKGSDALTLEITLKDVKEPLKLTVGKTTDAGLYASASTFNKDVLLIPKTDLDELKKKPKWLER